MPAEGYFPEQLRDLEATIRQTPCDLVLIATPIDLSRLITIDHPALRVTYRVEDWGEPTLEQVVEKFIGRRGLVEMRNQPGRMQGSLLSHTFCTGEKKDQFFT